MWINSLTIFIALIDTVIWANLLRYWVYYMPLQMPFGQSEWNLLAITIIVSIISILAISYIVRKKSIKKTLICIIGGNIMAIAFFLIIRKTIGNYIVYKIFKILLPLIQPINVRDELFILIILFVYIGIAMILSRMSSGWFS